MAKRTTSSWENSSKFKHSRSMVAVAVVVLVAVALIGAGVLLTFLNTDGNVPTVSTISLAAEKIGMSADLNEVYVKIIYNDNSTREVALSQLMPEGLDLTYAGQQTITINYGNQAWSFPVTVVSANIKITYTTSDGGYIEGDSEQEIPAGQNGATVQAVANEGYHFVRWNDGLSTPTRQEKAVSRDTAPRALFERNSYTVSFQRADGRWEDQTVLYGDAAVVPDTNNWKMKNYGYKFLRWDDSVASQLTNVTGDILVRGVYSDYNTKFKLYVTGDAENTKETDVSAANHKFGSDNQVRKAGNATYTTGGHTYTRQAYVYEGFYAWDESGVISVAAAQGSVLDKWLVKNADGQWIEIGRNSTVIVPSPTANLSVPGDASRLTTFSAGVDSDSGAYQLTFRLNPNIEANAVLEVVAVMEYSENTVTFYNNSIVVETEANVFYKKVELPYYETLTAEQLLPPEETSGGYVWDGWYVAGTSTKVTTDTVFTEDTSLVTRWNARKFDVYFEAGISDYVGVASVEVDYKSAIGNLFPKQIPSAEKYVFEGWFDENNVAVTESTVVNGDMHLTPRFTPKVHIVSFNVASGHPQISVSVNGAAAVVVNSDDYYIEEPSNYIFTVAWDSDFRYDEVAIAAASTTVLPTPVGNSVDFAFKYDTADGSFSNTLDTVVSISLALKEFSFDVTNGTDAVTGQFSVTGYSDAFTIKDISLNYTVGSQIEYTVTAPVNMVVASVAVDGGVPVTPNTSTYTALFGNYQANHTLVITYATKTFNTSYSVEGGAASVGTKAAGESYSVNVQAAEGKYISKIVYNGSSINLYQFASGGGYRVSPDTLKVNYRTPLASEIAAADDRVTYATFIVDEVYKDVNLTVYFADIAYALTFAVAGYGEVLTATNVNVSRGGSTDVGLSTTTGYYVAGYQKTENGVTTTVDYINFKTKHTESLTDVREDAAYTFIFKRQTFTVLFSLTGSATVAVDGSSAVLNGVASYQAEYGTNKTYRITTANGYYLSQINLTSDGTETLALGNYVSSYDLILNNIKTQYTVAVTVAEKPVVVAGDGVLAINQTRGGTVTAPLGDSYVKGDPLLLTVVPAVGYRVKNVVVGSSVYVPTAEEAAADSYVVTYTATDVASLSVTPYFEALTYTADLSIDSSSNGQGKIAVGSSRLNAVDKVTVVGSAIADPTTYDREYYVYFIADEGSFIESVEVDGIAVVLSTLQDYTIKNTNQKYSVGRLGLTVVGDVAVSVKFRKDVFTVTVLDAQNGVTEILGGIGGFENGEEVPISMEAATGYHISALYINGVAVEGFLDFSGDAAKYNSKKTYTYTGIDRNLTVVAEYELNYYNMDVTAQNVSPNFAGLDTAFAAYGRLSVSYAGGAEPTVDATDATAHYSARYGEIAHGDQVTLSIGVNGSNGYFIKGLTLRFLSGETVYYPVINGVPNSGDFGSYILSGSNLNLSLVIKSVDWDIYSVAVEYSRTTYTVSAAFNRNTETLDGPSSDVGLSFINDKSTSSPAIVSGSGNSYVAEYGLKYTVVVTPVTSHKLLSFMTTSGGDYTTGVRLDANGNNVYTNYVRADISFVAEYAIKTFEVSLTVNGGDYGLGSILNTSLLTTTYNYGDTVQFAFRPFAASMGGYIARFVLNNSELNVETAFGPAVSGTYTYLQTVTAPVYATVYFQRQSYDVSADRNVAGGNISLSVSDDEAWTGKVYWGDTLRASVSVFNEYNIQSVTYNNGTGWQTLTITEDMYDTSTGVKRLLFNIADIQNDYEILVTFSLKTFAVSTGAVTHGNVVVHLNDADDSLAVVTATTAVYIDVRPEAGYVISSVGIKMQNYAGTEQTLVLPAETYDALHVDYRRYAISDVTGAITVAVVFAQKRYTLAVELTGAVGSYDQNGLSVAVEGGGAVRGTLNMNTYSASTIGGIVYGDTITLSVKAGVGFDISSIRLNNFNYLAAGAGYNYSFASDTYTLTLTVGDAVVNNRDADNNVISGGDDLNLSLAISALKDVFTVEFDDYDDSIVEVTAAASMTYGARSIVDISVKTGYSITAVKVLNALDYDVTPTYTLLTDDGVRLTEFNFNMTVTDLYGIYKPLVSGNVYKYVRFVIEYEINTYSQALTEYVFDTVTSTTNASSVSSGVASDTSASFVDYETKATVQFVGDSTLVKHYSQVTVETSPIGSAQYVFWGFQEQVDGVWTAERVTDGNNGITFVTGSTNKFTYIADSARVFRAIYIKQYVMTVDIVPFHKSTTGLYVPNSGYINYLSYGSVSVDVVDPFDQSKTTLNNISSTNSQFQYYVRYGYKATVKGTDSYASQNRSTAVQYYVENAGEFNTINNVEAMSTEVTVGGNTALYAVFNNKVQFAMTSETVGGATGGEGATVTYKVGSTNKVLSNNAFQTAGFDTVTMTVAIKDNYRFDGLLRLVAQDRDATGALKWTSQWDTLFDFVGDGSDGVSQMVDNVIYTSSIDSNVTVIKSGAVLVFNIKVVDNSIYKLRMYKTYELSLSCVNGYSSDGLTANTVAGGATLSSTVVNNRSVDGRFDYGSTVILTSRAPAGNSQFVGWFVDGVNYYDLSTLSYRSAAEAAETSLTLADNYVQGKTELNIVAEYLPIYNLHLQNALTISGVQFAGATSETSMSSVWYDSTVINTVVSKESVAENFGGTLTAYPVLTQRVRFDLGADGKNISNVNNTVTLKVSVNPSYVFSTWSIKYGTSGAWNEIEASAARATYVLDLVAYLAEHPTTERNIYFKANLAKKNTVKVSKVVYYNEFGVPSESQGLSANVAYTGSSQSSASATTDWGGAVTVNVSAGSNYRFLGWYDITSATSDNSITSIGDLSATLVSTDLSYGFDVNKTGDSYTYFLEARFIRMVTITFAVENNSANKNQSFMYQVPFIVGNAANNSAICEGETVSTENTATGTYAVNSATASTIAGRHTVTTTMYVGTYVEYTLTNVANSDGFNPANHYYIGLAAGSTVTANGNKYTFLYDNNRTITVLYGAYGTINFSGILPRAQVTFGPSFTNQYLERHSAADTANGVYDVASQYSLRIVGGKLVLTNVSTSTVTASINNMPKVDYQTSTDPEKVAAFEKLGIWIQPMLANAAIECDIAIGFSYQSESGLTLDFPMDMMPFMRGQGTAGDPYIVRSAENLASIDTVYNLSGYTFGSTYRYFKMDTMLRDLSGALPDAQRYLYLGEWTAMCTAGGNGFDGEFNAAGWEIGGMTGTPSVDYYGVFGKTYGARIISFNFGGRNALVGSGNYYGIIAGYAVNTVFESVNLKDNRTQFKNGDTSVGSFGTTGNYLGLVAGYAESCTVNGGIYIRSATVNGGGNFVEEEDIYFNIVRRPIDGKYVGAMFGYLKNTSIGTTSNGMTFELDSVIVKGYNYVGGVAGYFDGNGMIDGVVITSGSFGTSEMSANVGGIVGYLSAGATLQNAGVGTSSTAGFYVYGVYRNITRSILINNNLAQFLTPSTEVGKGESAIGGFVGRSDGTIQNCSFARGNVSLYGSVAGGMVGYNTGVVKNVSIATAAKVSFDLEFGGVYGGITGYNSGMVSYVKIGSLNTFQGLTSDVSKIVPTTGSMTEKANVAFLASMQGSVSGTVLSTSSGAIFEKWGGCAMGGVAGYNVGKVYNSVTYGKVAHYKRTYSGSDTLDALGGIVGMNSTSAAEVRACGTSYGIVLSYTVVNTETGISGIQRRAIGGVVGNHYGGILVACFNFHSAVVNFINTGSSNGSDYAVHNEYSGVAGIVSSVPGEAVSDSFISWSYYTPTSYNTNYLGTNNKGNNNSLANSNVYLWPTVVNGQSLGSQNSTDVQFNAVAFTTQNYNTYVNSVTGHVYNCLGKSAALGDFANAAGENVTRVGYAVRSYWTGAAKVYAVDDNGNPIGTELPWQYNSSN